MLLILVKSAAHLSRCYCSADSKQCLTVLCCSGWMMIFVCISKGRHMEEKTAVFSLTGKCGHSILVFSSEALWSTQSLILPLCDALCANLLLAVQARLCRVHLRYLRKWSWHRREKAENQCWPSYLQVPTQTRLTVWRRARCWKPNYAQKEQQHGSTVKYVYAAKLSTVQICQLLKIIGFENRNK